VISREMVDAALSGDPDQSGGPVSVEPPAPAFQAPIDLDRTISRFNAIQRLVYRTVRSEVGAGAVNFIRACYDRLETESHASLEGAALQADGSWDTEDLRRAVVANRIDDPWPDYQRLIEAELESLRRHIGDTRVVELERRVERLADSSAVTD